MIGRWTLIAPIGLGTADAGAGGVGMALGTYEFRRSSMRIRGLGFEQPVNYSVSGNTVTVLPESFGPTLAIELLDTDTARLKDPLTGGLMTLRRVR